MDKAELIGGTFGFGDWISNESRVASAFNGRGSPDDTLYWKQLSNDKSIC